MAKHIIHVGLDSLAEMGQQFIDTWHRVEQGAVVEPYYGVDFEGLNTLLATLTPERWALLRHLRQHGPLSIQALTKDLRRDYQRVHGDVTTLIELLLIEQDEDGKVFVPWDEIEAHIRLAA